MPPSPPFDDPDVRRLYPFSDPDGKVNTFFRPDLTGRVHLKMNYLDEGSGEPVVMVHGNPTWSFYFRNLVHALRPNFRCIVPDHIGMGLSDKPPASLYPYSLKARIDDLEALLDSLGITQNITLVMQDWGGMIGMGYAARHPERIKRIIATNTGCTRLPKSKPLPPSLWVGRNTAFGAWLILKRNYFCRKAAEWCVKRKPLPADVRRMYLMPYDTPANRVAVLKFVQTIPLKPSDEGYDIVTGVEASAAKFASVPTLLLWGMKDFVFDKHFLAEWQRLFPHADTHTWPDCGHYLLEDAADEVIEKVKAFLGERSTPTSG
ncbi:MAG: alpha/beta fold hydrolase [Fimbriiglobus sp.]|nr:alpha/beta fold hydrolase [Fimbriiglobus sp.]